ncbi:MAG: serine/threonine-protein kinase [Gemmatimonas sp.]
MTVADDASAAARFERLEALFAQALEISPLARDAFVSAQTDNDAVLSRELRALLIAHERSESLSGIAQPTALESDADLGMRLGAFVVGRRIGMGGMGTVHEATRADAQYQQRVAVKFLRRSADDAVAVGRFRAEQQFLASLQHPNIAALLDGGVTPTGTPYFVMEYIDGEPITTWCDARQVRVRERLRLFRQVCLAVRAAHQRLVVHRDLKPGNIFVTAEGTVKLLDFGIAKLLDDAIIESGLETPVTAFGQQAFTPEYAAPEQILGEAVDTRADIYALGVVLFELMAGRRPFTLTTSSPFAMAQQLREATAPRLAHTLDADRWRALGERTSERARRRLSGDLDAIIGVALRADVARRYASVDALLDDLDRYLDGRPVAARPDGAWYRTRKFVARHALETGAGVIAVASLVTGVILSQQQARRAEAESARAREVTSFLTTMLGASNPESFGKDITMRAVLDSASRRLDEQKLSPSLDAEVRGIIGGTYLALGELTVAERQFTQTLAVQRRSSPDGDYRTARTLSQLSLVHESNGRYDLADTLLQQAERLYARFPHPDALQEVAALENRGRVLYRLGRNPEALTALRAAFAVSRARGKADDPAMAATYINAAVITSDMGENVEADSLAKRGYEIARQAHGDDYPLVWSAQAVRAGTLDRLGHADEAEALLRAVLEARHRILGETHPEYAFTMFNLADRLLRGGKWAEAADLSRRVLKLRGISIDDTHPAIAVSMQYLGRALGHLDSVAVGERWLRESLALRAKILPPGHWLLASSESAIGENLVLARRFPDAEKMLLNAEARLKDSQGDKAPVVRDARTRIVALYDAWGKTADAEKWRGILNAM